ncbi:aspartate kinase [Elongatibacter sediminis]|uniref:Aspartokinase n=1 Tax=Elongatibacter sediminis TaxID=3119006 RepID=A0AAW9RN01_9GAMM
MPADWIILKFGGTSVAGRPQWETIARLAAQRREAGFRVLLVCSAASGVTSALSALADNPGDTGALADIDLRHRRLARELEVDAEACLAEAQKRIRAALGRLADGDSLAPRADLLATGEWLSTQLGAAFLRQRLPVSWADAREALQVVDEPDLSPVRRWLSATCQPGADPGLARRWSQLEPVVITQGYAARDEEGRTRVLGRGGSDTSAALLGGRLNADRVEIWTDVPGLFSADPRRVPQARLITRLGYDEALEMASNGARVVHPNAIRAAQVTCTPLRVLDTTRPELPGSLIARHIDPVPGVKAITCQADMIVLLLRKRDHRREVGFLARVFEIVGRHGISVDLVSTSETTTSVAINGAANHVDAAGLQGLVSDLESQCAVTVHRRCACVNLVGREVRTALANLTGALALFRDHPLLMLSQSANDQCLSLLVKAGADEELMRRAHAILIPGPEDSGGVFGPAWADLEGVV